jgi:hypothetical protein
MLHSDLKQFIIEWNNLFPFDKWWRDKHKIAFGSKEHLNANQYDILLEYIEHLTFEEHQVNALELATKKERYKKDGWISKNDVPEDLSDEEFDNVKIEI